MKLIRYYRNAVIFPSIFIVIGVTLFSILDNYSYKSEWLTAESVILFSIITSIIYSLFICLLSLTIYLNIFEKINKNFYLSLLTWLFLPITCIAITLIYEINQSIKINVILGSGFIYVLIMTVPYVITLIWTFLKFRSKR